MAKTTPKPRLLVLLPWLAAAALAAGAAYAILGPALRPVAVVEPVTGGEAVDARPGSVTVSAEFAQDLTTEIGGRIVERDVVLDPGRRVSKGEILARLDSGDIDLEIEKTSNDAEAARRRMAVGSSIALDLQSARAGLANDERLLGMGGMAEADVQRERRTVQQLEQRKALEDVENTHVLQDLETTLHQKERDREKMTIRAPFDGVLDQVYARPHQLVAIDSPVARLISTGRVVEGSISEEDFANIAVGEDAAVILLPYGDETFRGKVAKVLPTADAQTQRHTVRIALQGIDAARLVPGITGETTITVDRRPARTIVPRRALVGDEHVLVVRNGRVEFRRVNRGYLWLTGVEITRGLEPGEQVIVEDQDQFQDGQRVRTLVQDSDAFGRGQ